MSQNQGDIQERIAAARREAESLKEKIRAKKESSADTSCTFTHFCNFVRGISHLMINVPNSTCHGCGGRSSPSHRNAPTPGPQRPFGQNLCHALGGRPPTSRFSITGWQAHRLGRIYYKQSSRYSSSIQLGHDLRLLAVRQFCGLWWSRQYLFDLQPEQQRREQCQRRSRIERPFWIPQLLPFHQRQTNCHKLW
jgi:hypothetical protein